MSGKANIIREISETEIEYLYLSPGGNRGPGVYNSVNLRMSF